MNKDIDCSERQSFEPSTLEQPVEAASMRRKIFLVLTRKDDPGMNAYYSYSISDQCDEAGNHVILNEDGAPTEWVFCPPDEILCRDLLERGEYSGGRRIDDYESDERAFEELETAGEMVDRLKDVYFSSSREEADRVWKDIDYILGWQGYELDGLSTSGPSDDW